MVSFGENTKIKKAGNLIKVVVMLLHTTVFTINLQQLCIPGGHLSEFTTYTLFTLSREF